MRGMIDIVKIQDENGIDIEIYPITKQGDAEKKADYLTAYHKRSFKAVVVNAPANDYPQFTRGGRNENTPEPAISELAVLYEIRTAIGCGDKPMQSELVEMVKGLVFIAHRLCKEHQELKDFTVGFGKKEPCECEACDKARKILP